MSVNQQFRVEATYGKKRGIEGKVKMMNRDEAKQFLIDSGVAEPTDEAVSNLLNKIHTSVKSAEDKALRYKSEADKVKELEKQLNEINDAKLTDAEKSAKAIEEANNKVQLLEQTVKTMQLQKSLAEIGIVGEDATSLVGEDGSLNTVKLGEILSAREKSAVDSFKKQALDSTPSPDGSKKDPDPSEQYKDITERVAASRKSEAEAVKIIDSYK